ncbi:hypothetical protein IW262DRAFT_945281 [Armillaria fumosa]|nr:hypothetical protein IW262DRAFT_945281 [Armillaria fumosa]
MLPLRNPSFSPQNNLDDNSCTRGGPFPACFGSFALGTPLHTPSITRIILVFGSTGQLAVHKPPAFEFWISSGPAPIQQFELEYALSQAEVLPSFCGAECSSLQHVLSVLTTHASPIWFPKLSISRRMLLSPLTIPLLSKLPTPSYYRHLYADFSTRARLMANNGKATLHVRRMIQNSVPICAPKLFARPFHFLSSQVDIDNTKVTV